MSSTTTDQNHSRQAGFTLVEILVIAPIALLVIGGFVAVMVTITGDMLVSNARSNLIQQTNSALERFEQDVRYANEFSTTSFTPQSPQGRNGATAAFDVSTPAPSAGNSNLGTLRILRSYATDKNPLDSTKKLIYTTAGPGTCGTATEHKNDALKYDIVYYLKRDSGTANTPSERLSLWRRIIFDQATLSTICSGSVVWQKSTCAPGVTGTPCQAEDEKLAGNITSIRGYYPNTPDQSTTTTLDCILACPHGYNTSDTTPHPGHTAADMTNVLSPNSETGDNAIASVINISTKLTVAGRDTEYSSGVFARRLND